ELASPSYLGSLHRSLEGMLKDRKPPLAILLSGGGNDMVKANLDALLNPLPKTDPVDNGAMDAAIGKGLYDLYAVILEDIRKLCDDAQMPVPVLLHPYAHPIPDGRLIAGVQHNPWSWLYPGIRRVRYPNGGYDLEEGRKIMVRIIDRFRDMQLQLAKDYENKLKIVVVPGESALDPYLSQYRD